MRGLLYREFYVNKKHCFMFGALALAFALLGFMVALSSVCGNIKNFPETDPNAWKSTMFIITYLPTFIAIFSVMGVTNSIYSDYESKWINYSYTIPTHYKKQVGVRYVAGIMVLAISLVFGMLYGVLVNLLAGTDMPEELFKNVFAIIVIGTVYLAIDVPLAYRCKNARTVEVVEIILIAAMALIIGLIALLSHGKEGFEKLMNDFEQAGTGAESIENIEALAGVWQIRDILASFGIIIIPVVIAVSLLIAEKIYKRREK